MLTATVRQLTDIAQALLTMAGRVTMLGLARWTGPGGSYRTVQRLFATPIPWAQVTWLCVRQQLLAPDDVYLVASDEVVVPKADKKTHGLDRFFSGIYQIRLEQVVRTAEEKAASQAKRAGRQTPAPGPKAVQTRPRSRSACRPSCNASRR